ncbi:MAG: hypothetical protein R3C05_23175 [Pirellulaceae bacterium]
MSLMQIAKCLLPTLILFAGCDQPTAKVDVRKGSDSAELSANNIQVEAEVSDTEGLKDGESERLASDMAAEDAELQSAPSEQRGSTDIQVGCKRSPDASRWSDRKRFRIGSQNDGPSLTALTSAEKEATSDAVVDSAVADRNKPSGGTKGMRMKREAANASTAEATLEDDRWRQWPKPHTVLFLTGEQHGYIEPCGCTGLENQKGGLARRHTLLKQIESLGWNVVPLDVGNQVRRYRQQAGIKFQTTVSALRKLGYQAVGFGPDDLKLDVGLLLSEAATDRQSSAICIRQRDVAGSGDCCRRFVLLNRIRRRSV